MGDPYFTSEHWLNSVPTPPPTQAGPRLFIVQGQTSGAQAFPTPRTELSRPQLSKNRLHPVHSAHSCEMILLGSPRDEAICGLSGLLLAAKGQAGDVHASGARAQATASGRDHLLPPQPLGAGSTWAVGSQTPSTLLLSFPPGLVQKRRHGEESRPSKLGDKAAVCLWAQRKMNMQVLCLTAEH